MLAPALAPAPAALPAPADKELGRVFSLIDKDKSKSIDADEWTAWLTEGLSEEQLKRASGKSGIRPELLKVKKVDKDWLELIKKRLRSVSSATGGTQDWNKLFARFQDKRKPGALDEGRFIACLRRAGGVDDHR